MKGNTILHVLNPAFDACHFVDIISSCSENEQRNKYLNMKFFHDKLTLKKSRQASNNLEVIKAQPDFPFRISLRLVGN